MTTFSPKPMMACGHAANSVCDGKPACVICAGTPDALVTVTPPDYSGRQAQCGSCSNLQPSGSGLPFFTFRGEGSPDATEMCGVCPYHKVAHAPQPNHPERKVITDHPFTPHGAYEYDSYYCGCRGWD